MKLDSYLTAYTKNLFKIDQRPKCKTVTIKLLKENISKMLHNIEFDNDLMWYQKHRKQNKK
jgi:hypothetical protein